MKYKILFAGKLYNHHYNWIVPNPILAPFTNENDGSFNELKLPDGESFKGIQLSRLSMLFLSESNKCYTVGFNRSGQLGQGHFDFRDAFAPVQLDSLSKDDNSVILSSSENSFSICLSFNNEIYAIFFTKFLFFILTIFNYYIFQLDIK